MMIMRYALIIIALHMCGLLKAQVTEGISHNIHLGIGTSSIDDLLSFQAQAGYGFGLRKHRLGLQFMIARQLSLGLSDNTDPIAVSEFNLSYGYMLGKNKFFFLPRIGIAHASSTKLRTDNNYGFGPTIDLDLVFQIKPKSALVFGLYYHHYDWAMYGISAKYQFSFFKS